MSYALAATIVALLFAGAAKAAAAVGDMKKAAEYFTKLARPTKDADGDRPALREARARVATQ